MMLTKRLQNKGRKLLAVTLSVFLVLSLVSFLSPIHAHAEGDNIPEKAPETCTEHLYSEEWMCEENGKTHFHECILCGEKLDIAEHIASDWIVDKAATLTKTGSQHKECTVCKIILLTEEIPVPEPEGEKAAHLFDEGKIIKDATEETEGTKTYTCETCGYTYNETIPKLEHTHKFSTEWQSDATSHWHLCKCGAKNEVKPHTAGDWIIDKKPTDATIGSQHKECTVCKKVLETKELPKLTAPKITAGAGQIYRQKSNQNLTITCSDNVENLTGVYVADGLVHKSNYVTDPQNQTVTLKAAYLDSLAEGTHSLKLAFSNGTYTETQFTIQKTAAVKTGDQSNYLPLIILLILSGGVLIVTSVIRKKGFNG